MPYKNCNYRVLTFDKAQFSKDKNHDIGPLPAGRYLIGTIKAGFLRKSTKAIKFLKEVGRLMKLDSNYFKLKRIKKSGSFPGKSCIMGKNKEGQPDRREAF